MIKYINRMLLVMLAFIGFAFAANAQDMQLPVDDAVRIGQLPNGLTYYIRHNEYPKGQADFYIAQKVGSVLEEDNQRGLAHFLEHMCFNGTTHFPGNGLRDWLESIGVKFGYNLNAYTSVDETVYNISNVPVARKGVQDSCLLILHDWANDLTLDPEEIEKERGVIHEEWRRTHNGRQRIVERILPTIYPNNNRYGHRMVIGTMEVVDNFEPQALRDYYETWYRPDQQGIIVVGDIDVDYIEGKIKEIFADIEMPENAKERVYFPVEDTEGTIYAIGGDPEETVGIAELMFKTDAIPNEMKGSMQYLLIKYINGMIETMLDQRLTDMGKSPDAPFAQAGAGYGEFFYSKTKDAFSIVAVAKDNDVLPGFEAAYRELLRAARGGFTVGEYERARAEYLSRIEKAYNGRETRENEGYVNEYVRHFIDNEPIPSIEDEYALMSQLAPNIPIELINSVLPEYVTPDNRVLIALYPENGTFKAPTQADFEAIIAKVDAEDIEPYKDETKDEPLIPNLPKPGKVTKITDVPLWDAKELTLSNGVKVVVKTTNHKKDEILFEAVALGGTSTIGDDQAANLIYLPYAQSAHALGTYNSIDIQRYLQGKQVSVDLSLGNYSRGLDGSSTVKDLPTLMELIYMTFTGYEFDPTEFEANQRKFTSLLAAQEANPQFIFSRDLSKTIYASAASQVLTPDHINAASREGILSIIKSMTANAADYTFYFVGDVTVEQITPLLEQYIATLPANAKKASKGYKENLGREIAAGSETSTYTTKMDNPQTWCAILVEGTMKYTPANKMVSSIAAQILSNRLLQSIREDMGATYSIHASGGMMRQGKYNTFIQIPFPMKPEMKEEVLASIKASIEAMTKDVTADELNPIKEFMAKSYDEDLERNNAWLSYMTAIQLNGVDTFSDYKKVLDSITVKDVEKFMQDLIKQNNYRVVILDPEATPAE